MTNDAQKIASTSIVVAEAQAKKAEKYLKFVGTKPARKKRKSSKPGRK